MTDEKNPIANTGNDNKDAQRETASEETLAEAELLEKLPPEARKVVEIGMSMHRFGPIPNPITEKLNDRHIDKILDIAAKDDERAFEDAKESRKFTLIYILVFSALFIFLTIFLVGSDVELYKEIIKLFTIFLGGLGSGFGIKSYMDRNK